MAQASLGEMIIRIVGDTALFDSSVDKSKVTLNNFYKELEKADAEFKKLEEAAKKTDLEKNLKLKEAIGQTQKIGGDLTKFVTLPILALGTAAVKVAGDFEQQRIALGTLLGSVEKGNELFETLRKEAAATPFELKDLVKSTTTLKAFGVETENLLPFMRMLGDVALGDSNRFSQLSLAFAQIKASGKLMGQDLLQLINAGFNPLQVISEKTGRSISDLKNDMSNGAISFEQVADAFKIATSEGGKFFKASENASKTLNGQLSTLKDNFSALLNEFGTALIPTVKDLIKVATDVIEEFNKLDDGTKKTIITVAALVAAIGPVISIGSKLISVVTTVGTSFAALGAVGGPILVVAAAIGFTALEMAKYKKNTDETIAIQQGFIKVMNESKQSIDQFKDSFLVFETSPIILKNNIAEVDKQISNLQANINNLKKNGLGQEAFNFQNLDFTGKNNIDPLAKQRQEVFRLQEELKKLQAVREKLIEQQSKVGPIEEKTITNAKTQTDLQTYLIDRQQLELDILGKTVEEKGLLLGVNDILGTQTSEILENIDAETKAFADLKDTITSTIDYVSQGFNVLSGLSSTLSNNRMTELNDEYNRQKENIEKTITDEKEKKSALEALDSEYEEKKRVEKKKAAEAEKAWSITNSIISTAVAVAKALPDVPLSILAGVMGAAQTAIIAAQAIPEFATGGFVPSTPGGMLARVAEAGTGEFMLPDRDDFMSRLANRITANMQQPINNTFSPNINNSINGPMVLSIDGQQFKAYINQQSARGNIIVNKNRGISKR
jgi:tape measure domain-containing protein